MIHNNVREYGNIFHGLSKSSHGRGVAVILSNNFPKYTLLDVQSDSEGRKVMVNIKIDSTQMVLTLISIYAPNEIGQRIKFFKDLDTWIGEHCKAPHNIIIGGDFNCCDKSDRQSKRSDKSSEALSKFTDLQDLTDIYSFCNPGKHEFTYIHPSDNSKNSRIDYIFSSNSILEFFRLCKIIYAPVPDHKAVTTVLDTNNRRRGKGYWKLNNSVLNDENYKNLIKQIIFETKLEYSKDLSKQSLLEILKFRVKEQTIQYCIKKAPIKKITSSHIVEKMATAAR